MALGNFLLFGLHLVSVLFFLGYFRFKELYETYLREQDYYFIQLAFTQMGMFAALIRIVCLNGQEVISRDSSKMFQFVLLLLHWGLRNITYAISLLRNIAELAKWFEFISIIIGFQVISSPIWEFVESWVRQRSYRLFGLIGLISKVFGYLSISYMGSFTLNKLEIEGNWMQMSDLVIGLLLVLCFAYKKPMISNIRVIEFLLYIIHYVLNFSLVWCAATNCKVTTTKEITSAIPLVLGLCVSFFKRRQQHKYRHEEKVGPTDEHVINIDLMCNDPIKIEEKNWFKDLKSRLHKHHQGFNILIATTSLVVDVVSLLSVLLKSVLEIYFSHGLLVMIDMLLAHLSLLCLWFHPPHGAINYGLEVGHCFGHFLLTLFSIGFAIYHSPMPNWMLYLEYVSIAPLVYGMYEKVQDMRLSSEKRRTED